MKSNAQSERGIALIVVLLLMAVLSGLATGFAMTGQVEVAMGTNEVYYAGARAAAEAGLNRAIVEILNDSTTNLLKGIDGLSTAIPTDLVNADNGSIGFKTTMAGGPTYTLSTQYTYTIEILDDDNPLLYETLSTAQITSMGENNLTHLDLNNRLILRATGFGPNGTTVRLARVIEVTPTNTPTTVNNPTLSNPALLVNGNLTIDGNISVIGDSGNVHANGNLLINGASAEVEGNAEASGTFSANTHADIGPGSGGGRSAINVPNIQASDYEHLATIKLAADGNFYAKSGTSWALCSTVVTMAALCSDSGWGSSVSSGVRTWSLSGNSTSQATYYVEGKVSVSGSPKGSGVNPNLAVSIIATGSITISGKPKFEPQNTDKIQFVTNGDLNIHGSAVFEPDDELLNIEGQMMVREQLSIGGNMTFKGRIMVQDVTSVDSGVTTNTVAGNPTIDYDGTLDAIATPNPITTIVTTYVNNISGWMEQ